MIEENFDLIGRDSGQKRASARTKERFPVRYHPVTNKEVALLRGFFENLRTSEREDVLSIGRESGDKLLSMGASKAQATMYQS